MLTLADEKAALARLDDLARAVGRDDAPAILQIATEANEFYGRLCPDVSNELELQAISYGVDAIAFAMLHAVKLLESGR